MEFLLHDYQRQRVLTLLDPEADALGQVGTLFSLKQRLDQVVSQAKGFLEEPNLIYISARRTYRLYYCGLFRRIWPDWRHLLIILYCAIIFRTFQIGLQSFHNYGRLGRGRIWFVLFVYVFVNAGMVSGILPVVGCAFALYELWWDCNYYPDVNIWTGDVYSYTSIMRNDINICFILTLNKTFKIVTLSASLF